MEGLSSTCLDGSWFPPLHTCHEKPRCLPLSAPPHGSINPISNTHHSGDTVTYTCNSGYTLHGPQLLTCMWPSETHSEAYWSPSEDVECIAMKCPELLPQSHGHYIPVQSAYYTGDSVILECHYGYYITNNSIHQIVELHCLGTDWSPNPSQCKLIIEISDVREFFERAEGHVRYAFPPHDAVMPSETDLVSLACEEMIGFYVGYVYPRGGKLTCYRRLQLTDGPDEYSGIVAISTPKGTENVCVEQTAQTAGICSLLGYSYTSSVYQSALSISSSFILSSSSMDITPEVKSCYYRISCRKSCETLILHNGQDCSSSTLYEGQTCTFKCDPGYALTGSDSSTLTCGANGRWSDDAPRCDGKHRLKLHFTSSKTGLNLTLLLSLGILS